MKIAIAMPPRSTENHIARALFALAVAEVDGVNAEVVARKRFPKDERAFALVQRSSMDPATTTTTGWAQELLRSTWADFLIGLAPLSAAARLIELGMKSEIGSFNEIKFPVRSGAPSVIPWVSELSAIPVNSRALDLVSIGPARKLGVLLALTKELTKRADGEAVIEQMLREDCAASIDAAYFSADSGTAARHAGLLNGLSSLSPFAGGDEEAMKQDLSALVAAIADESSGESVFVMSPSRAMAFPIKFPLQAALLTVLPSTSVPDNRVIAIDAASLVHGTVQVPDISVSEQAVVHMSDVPLPLVQSGTADPLRSVWQTDCIVVRLLCDVAFAKRRSNAVAYVDAVSW